MWFEIITLMVCGDSGARWAVQRGALMMWLLVGALAPERIEPCATSPLCSCRAAHMSCTAVPLHRFPEWPRVELQHLDISMANLEMIPESALDGLRLQTLVLVADKLHHIEQHALSSMSVTLASLDLGYNELTEVPQEGLSDLKVLNWLNLQNNYIAQVGGEIDWHHLEYTLTSLSLSNNQITQLKSQALTSLYHLIQLDLEGNHLRSISQDAFPSSLTILKLSNNFLHEISCDLIFNLPRLQSIHLRHNTVTFNRNSSLSHTRNKTKKIEKLDFSNNKVNDSSEIILLRELQIRQIILDFNELKMIPKLVYVHNRVERLSISYNKLDSIHREVFLLLKSSLERFEVEHNKLAKLPETIVQVLRLRHLSLAYNRLEEAPPLPPRIHTLSIAGNFLTSIPATLQTLEPGSIRYLDLSYNRITSLLSNEFLEWSSSLGTINLRGNRISQIYENVFPATMPVMEIYLSFNDLYYIHPQSFSNLTGSLHVIESSSTLFSGLFPFEIDEGLEALGWLSFDNNDFHILKLSDVAEFPYLKYLNLDYNRIVDIVAAHQNISILLSDLRVAYNLICGIHSRTFTDMPDLRNLDLSYNRISNLTKHSLVNLPNLRYLSLAGNIIDSMEAEALANLPRLEVLELQGNNFTYLSLTSFHNVSSDEITLTLNVSKNRIKYIDGESKLPVNIFDGSFNDMQEVPNDFFRAIEKSVRQIIMSHNKLIHISSEAFGEALHLETLDLHNNSLHTIKRKSFNNLISLQILDLSYNIISQLAVEQFYNLNKLRYLKLDHNNLRLLPRDVFKNTIIEHLDLGSNEISIFPETALSQIGFTLRYLDLSRNRLEYLDNRIFRNTQFLLNLNLAHNLLTVLSDNTFSCLGGLLQLDLSLNSVKANFKELFHNLPNLRHLNLANVSVKSVPYLPLTNLTSLNWSSNYINSFKETDVKQLANLRHLDLSHNRLTSLVPNMWSHLSNLNILDVSYNPVIRITSISFKWLNNLSHLNLKGLKYLDIVDRDSFRPLISLRSLHLQSWSSINYSTFRLCNITSSLPALHKLVIDWTDDLMDTQLHGIDARNLRYVEIKGESLQRISDEAFEPFAHSQEIFIKITGTSLTKLPIAFMKHLGQVPQLGVDLSYNQLTSVNPTIFYTNFTSWSHVATKLLSGGLILTGNPLRCECELAWLGAWLRRWLQENEGGAELRRAVRSATCKGQLGRRIPLLQLRVDEAECHASALSSDAQPHYTDFFYILIFTLYTLLYR